MHFHLTVVHQSLGAVQFLDQLCATRSKEIKMVYMNQKYRASNFVLESF